MTMTVQRQYTQLPLWPFKKLLQYLYNRTIKTMCIVIDIQTLIQILVQFEITGAFFSGEKSEMQKFSAIVNICKHIFFS